MANHLQRQIWTSHINKVISKAIEPTWIGRRIFGDTWGPESKHKTVQSIWTYKSGLDPLEFKANNMTTRIFFKYHLFWLSSGQYLALKQDIFLPIPLLTINFPSIVVVYFYSFKGQNHNINI